MVHLWPLIIKSIFSNSVINCVRLSVSTSIVSTRTRNPTTLLHYITGLGSKLFIFFLNYIIMIHCKLYYIYYSTGVASTLTLRHFRNDVVLIGALICICFVQIHGIAIPVTNGFILENFLAHG